jgi:hypothetical protein
MQPVKKRTKVAWSSFIKETTKPKPKKRYEVVQQRQAIAAWIKDRNRGFGFITEESFPELNPRTPFDASFHQRVLDFREDLVANIKATCCFLFNLFNMLDNHASAPGACCFKFNAPPPLDHDDHDEFKDTEEEKKKRRPLVIVIGYLSGLDDDKCVSQEAIMDPRTVLPVCWRSRAEGSGGGGAMSAHTDVLHWPGPLKIEPPSHMFTAANDVHIIRDSGKLESALPLATRELPVELSPSGFARRVVPRFNMTLQCSIWTNVLLNYYPEDLFQCMKCEQFGRAEDICRLKVDRSTSTPEMKVICRSTDQCPLICKTCAATLNHEKDEVYCRCSMCARCWTFSPIMVGAAASSSSSFESLDRRGGICDTCWLNHVLGDPTFL